MKVSSGTICDLTTNLICRRKACTLFILIITLMCGVPAVSSERPETDSRPQKNLLVLHSFHKGLSWNDRLGNGIESILMENPYPVRIFYEYMDAKRIFDNRHIQNLYTLYKHKFNILKFDAAIITDDQAFQFMLNYHSRLFPETPVVFCGVNYFTEHTLYGQDQFTGILQTIDIDDTLNLAITLSPKVKNAFVIVDKSPTSIAAIQLFIEKMKPYRNRLSFYFNEDMNMDELLYKVSTLSSEWFVIIVNFTVDKSGHIFPIEQGTRMITEKSNVPVYSFWDSYLGNGIIGGKLVSGSAQGKLSAQMVLDIFNGQAPSQLDIIQRSPNKFMFDHIVLEKFGINHKSLPKGSLITNRPLNFYEEYKTAIWSFSAGLAGLSAIIVLLSINIFRRIKAEKDLKQYSSQLETQNKLDRAILEAKPTEKIASDALKYVRSLFQCNRVSVLLFDYELKKAVVLAVNCDGSTALDEKSEFPLADFRADDLKKGNIVYARDIRAIPGKSKVDQALMSESVFSYVRIPLIYHGKLIGALSLGHSDFSVFDPDKVLTVNQISTSLALAIQATIFVNNIVQREKDLKKMSAILFSSQEDERKRISLELHDELGQALTAMNMNLSLLERKILSREFQDSKINDLLNDMTVSIKNMAGQLRNLSHELRPPALDVLGLLPALKSHINGVQKRSRIRIHQEYKTFDNRFRPEIEINLFRIIQESLHNVVKHSDAKKVFIYLKQREHHIHLSLQDNGKGFELGTGHRNETTMGMGILGMQERSTNLGGKFNIVSGSDIGTRIDVELPLHE